MIAPLTPPQRKTLAKVFRLANDSFQWWGLYGKEHASALGLWRRGLVDFDFGERWQHSPLYDGPIPKGVRFAARCRLMKAPKKLVRAHQAFREDSAALCGPRRLPSV